MQVEMEKRADCLIVRCGGELDHHYAAKIRTRVDEMIANGIRHVLFDFSKLTFMDSSGIGVIMGRYKQVAPMGGDVAVFGLSPAVDKLLTMSGIKKIAKVYKDERSAMEGMMEVNR